MANPYADSYPLDPDWRLKISQGIAADELAEKVGLTLQEFLDRTLKSDIL